MTTTITLNLPDEVAQKLQAEAQQQNTTLENLADQWLMQRGGTAPNTQPKVEIPGEYTSVFKMFDQIRAARQAKRDHVKIATTTSFARLIASSMVRLQLIQRMEIDETESNLPMTLHLSKRPI